MVHFSNIELYSPTSGRRVHITHEPDDTLADTVTMMLILLMYCIQYTCTESAPSCAGVVYATVPQFPRILSAEVSKPKSQIRRN